MNSVARVSRFCYFFTLHVQRERGKRSVLVSIYVYIGILYVFVDQKIFESYLVIDLPFQTFAVRHIYRLALPLLSPEMLSSLSKLRSFAHFVLFV